MLRLANPVRRISGIAAVSVFAAVLGACVAVPRSGETLAWDEEVVLRSGERLSAHRTVYGTVPAGRSTPTLEQTIAFDLNGRRFEWTDESPFATGLAGVLENVNGEPVIVMPVYKWRACYKHAFPQEGLVAFRFRGGKWLRVPIAELPKDLKVNLLTDTHPVRHDYKGKTIYPETKVRAESSYRGSAPKQGALLEDLARYYSQLEEACGQMRPFPELDAARERIGQAEQNATVIRAVVLSVSTTPDRVTSDSPIQHKGQPTEVGSLGPSCRGIVEAMHPLHKWSGNGIGYARNPIGAQMLVRTTTAPTKGNSILFDGYPRDSVACDEKTILLIRRRDTENLLIDRFSHDGRLLGAYRIVLPGASKFAYGPRTPELWVGPDAKGDLAITIADYTRSPEGYLIYLLRATYKASLPAR
jgi:hypothetical protein